MIMGKKQKKFEKFYNFTALYLLLSLILTLSFFNSNITFNDKDNKLITKQSYNQTDFITKKYNENLTRVFFEIFIEVIPEDKDILITAQFTYQNSGLMPIKSIMYIIDITTILIDSRISSIDAYDSLGNLYYQWDIVDNAHLINVTLRKPMEAQQFYSFSISYLLDNAVFINKDIADTFILQWIITHDEYTEEFALIVLLPNQYTLENESALEPEADYIAKDNKRFEWDYSHVLQDESQTWIIRFQLEELPTTPPPPSYKPYWLGIFGALLFGIIVGGFATFFIIKARTDIEKKEIVETLLAQPEKEIIRIIKEENGVTTQSKICSSTEFSKAKVSYYLAELEKKGIIAKERWGRMNRIRIVDNTVEKVDLEKVAEEEEQ